MVSEFLALHVYQTWQPLRMRALGCSAMASKRVVPEALQRRLKDAVKANDIDEAKKCIDDGGHPDTICDNPWKVSVLVI